MSLLEILVVEICDQRYALPIAEVVETVRAVNVTPLPKAPAAIEGVINFRGRLAPVLDMRVHLGLPKAELAPGHDFVVATCGQRLVALHVDRADCVVEVPEAALETAAAVLPRTDVLAVAKLPQGMVFILALTKFLGGAAGDSLDEAMGQASPDKPLVAAE